MERNGIEWSGDPVSVVIRNQFERVEVLVEWSGDAFLLESNQKVVGTSWSPYSNGVVSGDPFSLEYLDSD